MDDDVVVTRDDRDCAVLAYAAQQIKREWSPEESLAWSLYRDGQKCTHFPDEVWWDVCILAQFFAQRKTGQPARVVKQMHLGLPGFERSLRRIASLLGKCPGPQTNMALRLGAQPVGARHLGGPFYKVRARSHQGFDATSRDFLH